MSVSRPRFALRRAVALLLLAALGLGAWSGVASAGWIWDDDQYLRDNRLLDSMAGLERVWTEPRATPQYYPLVFTSFALERRLFGPAPLSHHVVNALLHLVAALFLWRILARLRAPAPWLAAALFLVHPVQAESVAWITERKNVLSLALALASLDLWIGFRGLDREEDSARRWPLYAGALALYAAALLAKSVACAAPAAALLLVYWRRGRIGARDLRDLAPWLWLGAAQGLLTARLERDHVGAVGEEWGLGALERLTVAGRGLVVHLEHLLRPDRLSFNYPRVLPDPGLASSWIAPLGVLVAFGLLWGLRRRIGRGPFVVASTFAGALVPALGFFDVYPFRYAFVADHFGYHATPAAAAAAAALLGGRRRGLGRVVVAGLVLVVLVLLTRERVPAFRDEETLWRDTLAAHAGSGLALHNLGLLRFEAGDLGEAEALLRRAAATGLDRDRVLRHLSLVLTAAGRPDEALATAEEARALGGDDPEGEVAVASVLLALERPREALAAVDRALARDSGHALAMEKRALALHALGREGEAWQAAEAAIRLDPERAGAWTNLGLLRSRSGDRARAIEAFRRALALEPGLLAPRLNLAQTLLATGDAAAAEAEAGRALATHPASAEARWLRARARRALGDDDGAARELGRLLVPGAPRPLALAAREELVALEIGRGRLEAARAVLAAAPAPRGPDEEFGNARMRARVLFAGGDEPGARRAFSEGAGPRREAAWRRAGHPDPFAAFIAGTLSEDRRP
ncbi:MAG: tetratricopeptide repeat protein [Planctomycetota bacterium]